ncbi:enoyl-CoA hydratase/isomerase family protein [Geobacter grbiciae]|uniref:enoyl-CoA hydratase/isomerase family protein n=1 Tax=Geobacter grbiciae TaxID=155042 RepID=UPI001FEBB16B|nr:enoyl-CoA hydratase-related protein [Geobacter grbiciae]
MVLSAKQIAVRHDDAIAVVSLARPESRNVLSRDLVLGLLSAFTSLKDDGRVKGIVVTGEGKSFCAGADISEMARMSPAEASSFAELGQRLMFAVERVGKPVVAAVNGHALGGGLELALACDFIVAAESAVFAAPEVLLGVMPGFGGTQRLPRLIGKSRAKEMIFTGERINAAKAHSIGLVNRVVSDDRLLAETVSLVKNICNRGLLSLRVAKEVIDAGAGIDLATACLMERDAFALCFSTDDQKEGMRAFMEKREPRFTGR